MSIPAMVVATGGPRLDPARPATGGGHIGNMLQHRWIVGTRRDWGPAAADPNRSLAGKDIIKDVGRGERGVRRGRRKSSESANMGG